MNKFLWIIILNVNGLNAPIKRHRVVEWIRKDDLPIYSLQETHQSTKNLHRLKVNGWKKYYKQTDRKQKNRVPKLVTDKKDLKTRAIKRNPEGHFIILKGRFTQEHICYKHICTQHRSTQIHKENFWGLQERYWQQHNYSTGLLHPSVKNGKIFQTKYQQRYCGIEQGPTWNGLNWYI